MMPHYSLMTLEQSGNFRLKEPFISYVKKEKKSGHRDRFNKLFSSALLWKGSNSFLFRIAGSLCYKGVYGHP